MKITKLYVFFLPPRPRQHIHLSLPRPFPDVFARRFENHQTGKSGYAPVYKDFTRKEYAPLDVPFIESHLIGSITLGLYPLLQDNTSHFIAADFDGKNWFEDATRLIATCNKYNLPVFIERSRSGKGAHVWYFFDEPYPAHKSRKIFFRLLRESGNASFIQSVRPVCRYGRERRGQVCDWSRILLRFLAQGI